MNRKLVLLLTCFLVALSMAAQKRVTGRVTDSDGLPVSGAQVAVSGTKIEAKTDANGSFTLSNVPASARTLTISSLGMETQQIAVGDNVIVVLKEKERDLEEAVVIGYGTARKLGTVGGAVSHVTSEKIEGRPSISIADAVQGQITGLQVMNNSGDAGDLSDVPTFYIRGVGSLEASNDPLIVLDGTPVGTSVMNLINASDIESITTLKDASATSIYGARAANGVIVITTKKGRNNEAAELKISQKIGWSQLARRIGNPMSAAELLNFQLEHGLINAADYLEYKTHGANMDWQKYYFDDAAPMYQTNVSLRGGSAASRYFVSGEYLKNSGVDGSSFMKRYSLRSNLDTKMFDWLTFGLNQSIVYTDRNTNGYTYAGNSNVRSYSSAAVMMPGYWDPYDPESSAAHMIYGMGSFDTKWLRDQQPSNINDIIYNGSAYAQLTPIEGLTIKSQLGVYGTNTNSRHRILTAFPSASSAGTASASDSRSAQWTITNTAEYKWDFNEIHKFTALIGQEGIRSTSHGFTVGGLGGTDDRMLTLSNMTEANLDDMSESSSKYEFLSFFGRIDYSLHDRYFADFTIRNDNSSRFGEDNRSAWFMSGNVMWKMRNEAFMKDIWWLDALDVRAAIGSTGNAGIGNYASLGLIGATQYEGTPGWIISQPSNKKLGWEKQIQSNFGVTASFFNKLIVDLNIYTKKTKNMLMEIPLPYTTGFSSQMMNVGEMSNRGFEIDIKYDVLRHHDYFLQLRANFAYNTNKIDKLFYGLKEWPMEKYLLNYVVGKSLNYYMPIYAGVDKEDGAPMWYKVGYKGKAGHVFDPERMTKDNSNMEALYQVTDKPRFAPGTGGFGVTGGWKGISVNADFAFILGKYMVNNTYLWATTKSNMQNGFNGDRDMLHIWEKPGDLSDLPAFRYDSEFDTHLLENASFLRLKNLTVAYDLPQKWMQETGFVKNVRLSFITRNLFTITGYRGADPEIDTNISYGNYPATRQFVLGVEVTF